MVLLSNIAYTNRDVHHIANINGKFSTAYLEELGYYTDAFVPPDNCHLVSTSYYILLFWEYYRMSTVTISKIGYL